MLSRENWKDLVEIVGVISIVLSLVFVGLEVGQNTNAVQSTVVQAAAQQSYDSIVLLIENEGLRIAQSAIDGAPRDEQRRLLGLYYAALLRIQLNRFMQTKLGVVEVERVMSVGGRGGIYDRPSFQEWWSERRDSYDQDFVAFMEERVFGQ